MHDYYYIDEDYCTLKLDGDEEDRLRQAILERKDFVSSVGEHAVKVVDGTALYSKAGIVMAVNDGSVIEVISVDSSLADFLSLVVCDIVPGELALSSTGFSWVRAWVGNSHVRIEHPFPLRISIHDQRVLNEIDPAVYFRAVTNKRWTTRRMDLIHSVLHRAWKMGYVIPDNAATIMRNKAIGMIRHCTHHWDVEGIVLALAFCGVPDFLRAKVIRDFTNVLHAEFVRMDGFYSFVRELALPVGHIVMELIELAEGEMVRRKLLGLDYIQDVEPF